MPTEFLAQNGARLKQNTKIAVGGCPSTHPKAARHGRKKKARHTKRAAKTNHKKHERS